MTVATISEFRANLKRYVDDVINNSGSLLINRGNTAAVLISLDEYNSIKETEKYCPPRNCPDGSNPESRNLIQ
mgnify:CR=1 FL=1